MEEQLAAGLGEGQTLVGRSGIGKSTLFHLAAGLKNDAGVIEVPRAGRLSRIGMVFQQPRLLDCLPVSANVDIAVDAAGVDRGRGHRLLKAVGLANYVDAYPLASREASATGWRWRVRSPVSPMCCFSTSPSARSTS